MNRSLALAAVQSIFFSAFLATAPHAAEEPRPMTAEDLWAMERVGNPALSPDGSRVAFAVTRYSMEDNKGDSDVWLVAADGSSAPRRLTWNEGTDTGPVWSPDAKSLLFRSKRGDDEAPQLYLLPLDGGEARRLTTLPVAPQDPKWSPDGGKIYFLATTWPDLDGDFEAVKKRIDEKKEEKTKVHITENRLVRYWDHYVTDGKVIHLFVLDVASGTVTDLTPGSERLLPFWGAAGSWDLSPDGEEIAFTANSTAPPFRTLNFDVYLMPSDGGQAENITAGNLAFDGNPRYSPDGRSIVYGRGRRPEIAPDFTRLARFDRRTRQTAGLTDAWDRQPSGWTFTPDGKTLVFHGTDAGQVHVYSMPANGGEPRRVVTGHTTRGVDAGPGGLIVFREESLHRPSDIKSARLGNGRAGALTEFNRELLSGLDLGATDSIRFKGAGADDVQMFVLHPPGFDASKKWPLVHLVHGGPHGSWVDGFHYRWNAALWASRGYVVTAVNFHGSTGRGQAFAESILGNHADLPFEDMMRATDHMLALGYVDPDRMAAAGGSYGGYLVSWMLGHTDRFAAFINHAGVYDLMAQFASDYTWGRPNNYGASPWDDPSRIDLHSPSRFAKQFDTPTLIIHGEKDYRVPYTQGLNLHQVLTGKGVPSRLVVFPEENHWVLKPQAGVLWWNEVFDWLERHIGAGPTPGS